MLKTKEVKEVIKVEDKQVFAVIKETNEKRKLQPCETREYLTKQIDELQAKQLQLEKQLKTVKNALISFVRLDAEIKSLGYCNLSTPLYKKVDGMIIRDKTGSATILSYTHSPECKNKEQ